MQLLKFIEAVNLLAKPEVEKAKLLCFYHYKENGETAFSAPNIAMWMEECGFSKPNTSRLKANLTKGMFVAEQDSNNKKALRRKLLARAKDFAASIIKNTEK